MKTRLRQGFVEASARQARLAREIADVARQCHARGWALGTSGNFSAVRSEKPLRLLITASGVHKGDIQPGHILEVDGNGRVIRGSGRPSDETALHLTVVGARGARAVLHSHSVFGTILSEVHSADGGISIEGYEMLKGLTGVTTHAHREWVPVLENSQDYAALAQTLGETLRCDPAAHGVLLRGHGLYTWGRSVAEARRHLEILEFLFEVRGRQQGATR